MAGMLTQRGVDHHPCYTSSKIGTVTGRNGSMETAALHLVNVILHALVFQIIVMTKQDK